MEILTFVIFAAVAAYMFRGKLLPIIKKLMGDK